jgi:proliferating cell nuclear antigen
MNIDAEQMTIPDTPYKCNIQMPAGEFQRIVRDLQVMGDTCTISCNKEGVRFSVSGSIGTGNILVRANAAPEKEEDKVMIDMEEPVELNFALRYLNFFTKATPLANSVVLCMSPNVPIVVEYPVGDNGHVKYFLAPKIDEGDEEMEEDA